MYSKPCMTHVDTESRLIHDQETILYWIFVEPATKATLGTLSIYDGWSAAGVEKCRLVTGEGRLYTFNPPFICNDALYIAKAVTVASYSLGFLPAKVAFAEDYKVKRLE